MTPRMVMSLIGGVWLFVTVIVVGYPLCTGKIRVGLYAVYRDAAPKAFWTNYIISTVLFITLSLAVGVFLRVVMRPLGR